MSTDRRRSWRPEKKRGGRASRQRTTAVLAVVLAMLMAVLVVPPIFQEPPFRFVSMVASDHVLDPSGLPVFLTSAASSSDRMLKTVFEKLNELNDHHVMKPRTASSLTKLKEVVRPGETLLLYCGLETVVRCDDDAVSVQLLGSGNPSEIPFSDLLEALKGIKPARVVLLMDLVRRESGLANGRLGDDVLHLIEVAVEEASINDLVVICSSNFGERSWEYFESSEPSDVANVVPPTGDGRLRNNDRDSDIFSGTVFGHFVRQAFIDGRTTDVDEFHRYLREQVATWVETNYGEKQSVMLFPQEPRILGDRLLVNVEWPSASDLADSEAGVETAAGDSESIDASKSSEQIAETDTPDAEETPTAKLDKLHLVRRRLQEAGEAVAATPAEWMEFNAALLAAEMAILHGDLAAYATMHDLAQENIDRIADHKNSLRPTGTEADRSEWILASVANPETEAASAEMFELAFQDDVSGEKLSRLPRELRRSGPERGAFVRRFVDHLRQVAGSTRPEDQQKQIAVCARFIQELPERGWPMQDWPNELLTIAEVLVADDVADDDAWQAQALEPLLVLIELRKQVLDAATGKLDNGASIRRHVWHQIRDDVQRLLTGLTAAERWLSLGPPGLKKAQSILDKVASEWDSTVGQIHQEQQLVAIRDRQRTDLPLLIQFLAQQQEEVPLRKGELQDAIALAEASESEIRSHFPHGLLGQPNMHSKDIDAMFALTRDLTENEDAVTPHDLVHQKCLIDYVLGRRGRSELLSVSERRRLFAVPTFGLSSEEVETSRGIRVGALTDKGGGPPAAAGQLKRTGLWVSFWSIRLLEAISGVQQKDLWQEWKLLVKSFAADELDRQKLAQARSQLASLLQTAWHIQHVSLADSSDRTIFVDNEDARKILAADVAQRHAASEKHWRAYEAIHKKLAVTTSLEEVEAAPPSHSETTFNDKNDAEISVDTEGADFLYVSTGAIQLQRDGVLNEENDWYRIDSPSATEQLIFHSRADVTAPVEVYLAFTNEHHVVFKKQSVFLHPDSDNQWTVEFLAVNEEERTKQELIEGRLELLPTTRNPKDDKDIPLSYIVRLVQISGVATRVRVQCFDSKDVAFWETGQILDLDPQTKSVEVPLSPAVDATPPTIPDAPAKDFDALHGIRFEITPEGLKDPRTKNINIQPVLLSAERLVRRPEPIFDGSGKLTIRIVRQSSDHFGGFPPKKLPAEVHFSPALAEQLIPGNVTGVPNIAVGEQGNVFTFTFRNDIVQAFRRDDFVQDGNDLEFSVSVAGIPYAWHWRLNENDAPELLLNDEPTVRIKLRQTNSKEVKPVADSPTYLFGENWVDVRFDVRAHIHGGRFDHRDHQWQLDIKRLNDGVINRSRPISILSEPIKLGSHHDETIRVASGMNNVWHFSTHTELHGPGDLPISEIGEDAGRYKLIGQLKRIDSDETIEHETHLVFDHTPPVVTVEVDPGSANSHSVLKPLKGRIVAEDPESGIATIRAGFSVEDLVDVKSGGEFEFPAAMLPKIPSSKEDQRVPHKLYAEVTNRAGLPNLTPVRITFLRKANTMVKASDPVKNGKVIFTWESGSEHVVTLAGKDFKEVMSGTDSVKFSEVPPGIYTISWAVKGLDTGKGKKTVSVKSGATRDVTK
ncbi:MAG: hypothetical protein GY903_12500 [Fuerstiella sp.]|nr:hypothetical protein [Fuerstiella sp.]